MFKKLKTNLKKKTKKIKKKYEKKFRIFEISEFTLKNNISSKMNIL